MADYVTRGDVGELFPITWPGVYAYPRFPRTPNGQVVELARW